MTCGDPFQTKLFYGGTGNKELLEESRYDS